MTRTRRVVLLGMLVFAALAAVLGVGVDRAERAEAALVSLPPGVAAVAVTVDGEAEWSTGFGAAWQRLRTGDALPPGALLRTGPGSRVALDLGAERAVRLTEQSVLMVAPARGREAQPPSLALFLGRVWVNLRRELAPGERFTVETPAAVVGVRGTMFAVSVADDGGTLISVHRGKVEVAGAGVMVRLRAEEQVFVAPGQAPGHPRPLSAEERAAGRLQRDWTEEGAGPQGTGEGGGPGAAGGGSGEAQNGTQKEGKQNGGEGPAPGMAGQRGRNGGPA